MSTTTEFQPITAPTSSEVAAPITAQMIFDAAWQKFIIEEAPPALTKNDDGSGYQCRYLTSDGRKCAVGLCIPDGYRLQQSDSCLNFLWVRHPDLFKLTRDEAENIQDALHDDLVCTTKGVWNYSLQSRKEKYIQVAERFNLTIPAAKPCQTN